MGSALHPRSKSLPEKEFLDLSSPSTKQQQQTNGTWSHRVSASMDGSASPEQTPTLLQMSISRESDTSEISVFDDTLNSSSATSPEVTDKVEEESLYSTEEKQYERIEKLDSSISTESTTSHKASPGRKMAITSRKFYVDGLSNHGLGGNNTRKVSTPARHHLPKAEKQRVRKVKVKISY